MNDHKTTNMIDFVVHEIVEHEFQDLELALRGLTVGSILGYWNQNSDCSPVERVVYSYAQKYR